jgi:kynureninase
MSILHHGAVINMNSGRKCIGCFIHEKHHNNAQLPRFAWWGHNKERRFKMEQTFDPVHGVMVGKSVIYIIISCHIWPQSKCLMK